MTFRNLNNVEHRELFPGYSAKFVHSDKMTVAYLEIEKGYPAPEHSHPHEQVSSVISGEFELTVDGKSQIMKPGITAVIPPNVKHSGISNTDCKMIDVFCPVREDLRK